MAGPVGLGAAAAAKAKRQHRDHRCRLRRYDTAPDFKDIILTSVLKKMDSAVFDAVGSASAGNFSNEPYVGNLENDGVGAGAVPRLRRARSRPSCRASSRALQEQIISGELKVESASFVRTAG